MFYEIHELEFLWHYHSYPSYDKGSWSWGFWAKNVGNLHQPMTGMRVGLGVAWLVVGAAEMVAVKSGLGYLIIDRRRLPVVYPARERCGERRYRLGRQGGRPDAGAPSGALRARCGKLLDSVGMAPRGAVAHANTDSQQHSARF
jgi:hypothetical protein